MDVARCREGRLDYLGRISFILIAVLVSCLLLNEQLGDAFIDSSLKSMGSAIFILGTILYNLTLAALLVPIFSTFAMIIYYNFIYLPAKNIHEKRLNIMKERKQNDEFHSREKRFRQLRHENSVNHQKRYSNGFSGYFSRIFALLWEGILTLIVNISGKNMKNNKKYEVECEIKWCAMNKPGVNQGIVLLNYDGRDYISELSKISIELSRKSSR